MINLFSPHKITDGKTNPFSAEEYSRFKHGSKKCARKMGIELAESYIDSSLFQHYADHYSDKQIVVLSSPYNFVPTATYAMKDYFMSVLNTELFKNNIQPAQECKIVRGYSYVADYSTMSYHDRKKSISGDVFHVDASFLKDKYCIFIDDIRITGSHEDCVIDMLSSYEITNNIVGALFMYYAIKTDPAVNPSIEDALNRAYVKDLKSISRIIQEDGFLFNTRNIKFILNTPSEEFKWFLAFQKASFVETLYRLAIGNSYNKLEEFQQNFEHINELLNVTHVINHSESNHFGELALCG